MVPMEHLYGRIWTDEPFYGRLCLEDGKVIEMEECPISDSEFFQKDIFFNLTDTHTHIGDAGLTVDRKYSLEELVAPPNGLKHRYLRETDDSVIVNSMKRYASLLRENGTYRIIDFREGGLDGISMISHVDIDSTVMGRPVSPEFDINEMESILKVADGIGISSISDMDHSYIDSVADIVHRKGKYLAIHVSERIREDIDYVLSLNPDLIVHMCEATDADLKKIADEEIPISICVRSNLYFDRMPPLKRMESAGCMLSVGTDNAMLSTPNIFDESKVFREVAEAQGCSQDLTFTSLSRGRKILNKECSKGVNPEDISCVTVVDKGLAVSQIRIFS